MIYEVFFFIPELILGEMGMEYTILRSNPKAKERENSDEEYLFKDLDFSSMTKEKKKAICRTITIRSLITFLITAAVATFFSFLMPKTVFFAIFCLAIQVCICIAAVINLKKILAEKSRL